MSPFVSPVVRHRSSAWNNCHWQYSSQERHEDFVHIAVIAVVHWCLRAETHPYGNVVRAVIILCLRFGCHGLLELDQLNGVIITWCALIGTRCRLAACNCTSSLELWTTLEYELADANGVCQSIQKVRVEPATRCAVATWTRIILIGFAFPLWYKEKLRQESNQCLFMSECL